MSLLYVFIVSGVLHTRFGLGMCARRNSERTLYKYFTGRDMNVHFGMTVNMLYVF